MASLWVKARESLFKPIVKGALNAVDPTGTLSGQIKYSRPKRRSGEKQSDGSRVWDQLPAAEPIPPSRQMLELIGAQFSPSERLRQLGSVASDTDYAWDPLLRLLAEANYQRERNEASRKANQSRQMEALPVESYAIDKGGNVVGEVTTQDQLRKRRAKKSSASQAGQSVKVIGRTRRKRK